MLIKLLCIIQIHYIVLTEVNINDTKIYNRNTTQLRFCQNFISPSNKYK